MKDILLIILILWGIPSTYFRNKFRKIVYKTEDWKINIMPLFSKEIKSLFLNMYPDDKNYIKAYGIFSKIIEKDPNWAEAWNRRATSLYFMGKYKKSLRDIDMVLKLESRHFGALIGKGQVYMEMKDYEKAYNSYLEASYINPMNTDTINQINKWSWNSTATLSVLLHRASVAACRRPVGGSSKSVR